MITSCKTKAAAEQDSKKWDAAEAKTIYEELGDYSDSVSRKVEAEEGIEYLEKYNKANKLYEEGKYDEAITAFKALDGYKDSEAQIEKIRFEAAQSERGRVLLDIQSN